jgi:hypothetical protein
VVPGAGAAAVGLGRDAHARVRQRRGRKGGRSASFAVIYAASWRDPAAIGRVVGGGGCVPHGIVSTATRRGRDNRRLVAVAAIAAVTGILRILLPLQLLIFYGVWGGAFSEVEFDVPACAPGACVPGGGERGGRDSV